MHTAARALALLSLAAALAVGLGGPAEGADTNCRAVAGGPFLYVQADLVIPESYVECATTQNRIRVFVTLFRDGVVVQDERRDCRKRSICHLDIDASEPDLAGDQQWCVTVSGVVGATTLPAVTACEDEAF
jgi:hypothetical protein